MRNTFNLLLLYLVFSTVGCLAQPCSSFSIGQFFDELKSLKPTSEKFSFKRYSDFDFVSFKPIDILKDDSLHYVDVGYDTNKNVKELIFRKSNENYSLIVYDFKDHRILLLKLQDASDEWLYTPTAILVSKCGNYMINVRQLFEVDYNPYELFKYFPISSFEKVSCLMSLRDDLYPEEFIRFSNGKIATFSGLKYESPKSYQLEWEDVHFFVDPDHYYSNLSIDKNSSMKEIMEKTTILRTISNMIVFAKPNVFKEIDAPLWIFSGAHSYLIDK